MYESNYRLGDCDAFALAAHHLTGWPIYKVSEKEGKDAWHWLVKSPGGAYYDAEGAKDSDEILAEHEFEELPPPSMFLSNINELRNYRSDTVERSKLAENEAKRVLKL